MSLRRQKLSTKLAKMVPTGQRQSTVILSTAVTTETDAATINKVKVSTTLIGQPATVRPTTAPTESNLSTVGLWEHSSSIYWKVVLVGGSAGLFFSLLIGIICWVIIKKSFKSRLKKFELENQALNNDIPVFQANGMPAFRKDMTKVDAVKTPSHLSMMRKQYEEDYVSMDGTNAKKSNHKLADFKQQVEVAATERHETGKKDRNQMSQVYEEPIRTRCVCNIDSTDMYYNTVAAQSSKCNCGADSPYTSTKRSVRQYAKLVRDSYENTMQDQHLVRLNSELLRKWGKRRKRSLPCLSVMGQSPNYEEMQFRPLEP